MNKIRQHLRFTGRVQGVGFRYTSYHLATSLGLTGWVYNEWDGSVEMEIQGESEVIQSFLEKIDNQVFIEIDNIEKENIDVIEKEYSFKVKE